MSISNFGLVLLNVPDMSCVRSGENVFRCVSSVFFYICERRPSASVIL